MINKLQKSIIRKQMRTKNKSIAECERYKAGSMLREKIMDNPHFAAANVVALYLSLEDEVPTEELLKLCEESKKRILVPRIEGETMQFYDYNKEHIYIGSYSIREPQGDTTPAHIYEIDLIICPGVAFDTGGNRMGRGRGFYDKFLNQKSNTRPYKIGVGYQHQLLDKLDAEPHDVPMDELFLV